MPDGKITFPNGSEIAVREGIGKIRGVGPTFTAVLNPKTGNMETMWRGLRAADATCPHGVGLDHDCAECANPA